MPSYIRFSLRCARACILTTRGAKRMLWGSRRSSTPSMRIAFDLRRIKNPGIGRYMKCLVEAVLEQAPDNEYLLILPPDSSDAIEGKNGRVEKVISDSKYYSVREQIELP